MASTMTEPQSYQEAMESPDVEEWKKAMDSEYNSLIENRVWDIMTRPKECKVVQTRWLYKIKQTSDGRIEHFKARLVTKGYTQSYDLDYYETYSLVFKLASLQVILSIRAIIDLEIYQMDIVMAFLHGNVDTEVYIEQSEGYRKGLSNTVCKLNKGLYGLKQSARL